MERPFSIISPTSGVFGGATSHRVDFPIAAECVDLHPFTIWAVVDPTTLSNGRGIFSTTTTDGSEVGFRFLSVRSTGAVETGCDMTTTDANARSSTGAGNVIATGQTWMVAGTVDASLVPRLYIGRMDVFARIAQVAAYATQTTGVGTSVSDAGGLIKVGNRGQNTLSFQGRIYNVGYEREALNVAQLAEIQQCQRVRVTTEFFALPGLGGPDGKVKDWSRNKMRGVITGMTLGARAAVGPALTTIPFVVKGPTVPSKPLNTNRIIQAVKRAAHY